MCPKKKKKTTRRVKEETQDTTSESSSDDEEEQEVNKISRERVWPGTRAMARRGEASFYSSRPSWRVSLFRPQSGIVRWYKEPAAPFSETVLIVTSDQYCVRVEVQVYTSTVLAALITSTRPRPCFHAPAPVPAPIAASWSPSGLLPGNY